MKTKLTQKIELTLKLNDEWEIYRLDKLFNELTTNSIILELLREKDRTDLVDFIFQFKEQLPTAQICDYIVN